MRTCCSACHAFNMIPEGEDPQNYTCGQCGRRTLIVAPMPMGVGITMSALSSTIGGAALGSAVGGPVGAMVGGVVGYLIGSSSR